MVGVVHMFIYIVYIYIHIPHRTVWVGQGPHDNPRLLPTPRAGNKAAAGAIL